MAGTGSTLDPHTHNTLAALQGALGVAACFSACMFVQQLQRRQTLCAAEL
jgi:hypothetical protein